MALRLLLAEYFWYGLAWFLVVVVVVSGGGDGVGFNPMMGMFIFKKNTPSNL